MKSTQHSQLKTDTAKIDQETLKTEAVKKRMLNILKSPLNGTSNRARFDGRKPNFLIKFSESIVKVTKTPEPFQRHVQ